MTPPDPLASLHPLREPAAIGWWPPAPGWWLLLVIALACLLTIGYILLRRYRANAYRRRALAQLQHLRAQSLQGASNRDHLNQVNALLKSVALIAWPRRDVAALSGQPWLDFLNSRFKTAENFPADFVTAGYRREQPDIDVERIHRTAERWIRRHRVNR